MEKVIFNVFRTDDVEEKVEFYVLEQTMVNGTSYLLVTDSDSEEEDAECLILKEVETDSTDNGQDSVYEIVEDDTELIAVSKVFEELLEDIDITM